MSFIKLTYMYVYAMVKIQVKYKQNDTKEKTNILSVKGGIYMKKRITAFMICILVLLTIPGTVMAKELQMKDIAISDCKVIFEVGDSTEIDLQNVPTGAKITWKSSDKGIVKVTDGKLTGKKPGKAEVRVCVKYKQKNKTKTWKRKIRVTVIEVREDTMLQPREQEKTVYMRTKGMDRYIDEDDPTQNEFSFVFDVSEANRIVSSSLHSTNENVVCKDYLWIQNDKYQSKITGYAIGAGDTDLCFCDKYGKEYKVTLHAMPYENPLSYVSVTNVENGKNLASMVSEQACYFGPLTPFGTAELKFSKKTKRPKIIVRAADHWIIDRIHVDVVTAIYGDVYRNINASKKTIRLKKIIRKDEEFGMHIYLKNTQTGSMQWIRFGSVDPDDF